MPPRACRSTREARAPWAVAVALMGAAGVTTGQAEPEPAPILHEDVPPPERGTPEGRALLGPDPKPGRNPAAFSAQAKILPAPARNRAPAADEPVLGRGGFAAERDLKTAPDDHTHRDGTLRYVTVFNPSVLPFKRMSALNAVHVDFGLYNSSRTREDLPVGGTRDPDRDLFWGSLALELNTGVDAPIPSVSPDMRILSYETHPPTAVTFSKDEADNFFVRSDETGVSGTYRLVFLADAKRSYFASQIPSHLNLADLPRQVPAGLVPPLPTAVHASARRALRRVGVSRGMKLADALDRLALYFRDFAAKPLPSTAPDIYSNLVRYQAGVCRHRAYAFMLTANAAGIPTRYVSNEAHAWVEVWVPTLEWLRLDLGGAALRMEVRNARGKTLHRARASDPFPRPAAFADNYTLLQGDIQGLSRSQLNEQELSDSQAEHEEHEEHQDSDGDEAGGPARPDGWRSRRGNGLRALLDAPTRGKVAVSLTVDRAQEVGYRGEGMTVRGRLRAPGRSRSLRVDIYLVPRGQGTEQAILVGHTDAQPGDTFTADVHLPASLELGWYEVWAASPGDSTYAPALSR